MGRNLSEIKIINDVGIFIGGGEMSRCKLCGDIKEYGSCYRYERMNVCIKCLNIIKRYKTFSSK